MCYACNMFETTEEFLEYWEVFLNNLDLLNIDVSTLERSFKVDSDDYGSGFDSKYAFEINQNKEGEPSIRISENMVKLRVPVKYHVANGVFPSMDVVFYGKAISDQMKLIDYIQANLPVFINVFSTVVDLENNMIKNLNSSNSKYNIAKSYLNRFRIDDLEKKMPFATLKESIADAENEYKISINFQFFYSVFSKSTFSKVKNFFMVGFFNEDFSVDFYYDINDSYRLKPENYEKFPLSLEECADEKNVKKFVKAVNRIVDKINIK